MCLSVAFVCVYNLISKYYNYSPHTQGLTQVEEMLVSAVMPIMSIYTGFLMANMVTVDMFHCFSFASSDHIVRAKAISSAHLRS